MIRPSTTFPCCLTLNLNILVDHLHHYFKTSGSPIVFCLKILGMFLIDKCLLFVYACIIASF